MCVGGWVSGCAAGRALSAVFLATGESSVTDATSTSRMRLLLIVAPLPSPFPFFAPVYVGLPVVFFRGDEGSFNYARAVLDIAFVLLTLTYSFGYYLFLSSKKRLI